MTGACRSDHRGMSPADRSSGRPHRICGRSPSQRPRHGTRGSLKGALIAIVTLTRGYPRAPFGWSGTLGTVPMIADGSLLRSEGETWGPVSPDDVHETGVSAGGQFGIPRVTAEPSRSSELEERPGHGARSEVFVACTRIGPAADANSSKISWELVAVAGDPEAFTQALRVGPGARRDRWFPRALVQPRERHRTLITRRPAHSRIGPPAGAAPSTRQARAPEDHTQFSGVVGLKYSNSWIG
jgi:hypothetical protein